MALEIDYTTTHGILCRDAICVIIDVMCSKLEDHNGKRFPVTYMGRIYANKESYEDNATPVSNFSYAFDLDESASKNQHNLLKQSYLNLKTKEGFTEGVDC